MYGIYSGGTLNRICTFFSQILTTISLLVIIVVDAAAVAVVVVVVVVVFDTGFLPLGDAVMIPISHPTVHLVGDVIMMSSGLQLLGNNLGLDRTGVFLSNFTVFMHFMFVIYMANYLYYVDSIRITVCLSFVELLG